LFRKSSRKRWRRSWWHFCSREICKYELTAVRVKIELRL
jgi:D-alanyl-D-alanine dipeptidase